MRRRRELSDPRRRWGRAAKILAAVAMMLLAMWLVELRIRPVVEDIVSYQARLFAVKSINGAMLAELEREGAAYGEFVTLTRGQDGVVSSIQTNVLEVNRLKARMADTVARQVESWQLQPVRVPLGTLLGSQLTSGRGPEVEIRVIPVGYVQSELYNQFTAAGINQTRHQIMLRTSVRMVAVLPGYSVETEASVGFCVAETVIVGKIPEGYTVVGEDPRSTVAKINDYRAGAG